MAKSGYTQNGVKRRTKRRNGAAAKVATIKAKNPTKRRTISLATAKAILKRNGLKSAKIAVQNPKRKKRHHKRRNGVTAMVTSRRNGLIGNTKHDVRTVGGVLGGAVVTKLISRIVTPFVGPLLSRVGMGNFAEIITDTGIALVIIPTAAKWVGMSKDVQNARTGGLLAVALDGIEMFAPGVLSTFNPFNTSPVVISGSQVTVAPKAVNAIVGATAATPEQKAAVAGAMRALETGAMMQPGAAGGMNPSQMMPNPFRQQ